MVTVWLDPPRAVVQAAGVSTRVAWGWGTATPGRWLIPFVMTPTEYRRLRRLLQRERQKGVVALDQLTDLVLRDTDDAEPVPGPEGVGRERVGADRGAGSWGGGLRGGPAR